MKKAEKSENFKSENCVTQNAKLFINRRFSVLIHVLYEKKERLGLAEQKRIL